MTPKKKTGLKDQLRMQQEDFKRDKVTRCTRHIDSCEKHFQKRWHMKTETGLLWKKRNAGEGREKWEERWEN